MIDEAIKAVKDAEAKAEEIISSAHNEADDLIQAAKQKSIEKAAQVENDSEKMMEDALAAAKKDGEAVLSEARESAAKEVEAIKAVASEKEELAISGVIDELIP